MILVIPQKLQRVMNFIFFKIIKLLHKFNSYDRTYDQL